VPTPPTLMEAALFQPGPGALRLREAAE
jgi:hypothetical protein